jgi:hypothetical protein
MRKRKGKLSTAGSSIQEALDGLGLKKKYGQYKVWEVWDKVVGNRIASIAQPSKVEFNTLFVAVSDSLWLQQLKDLQDELLMKLNKALGREAVEKIYFRLESRKRMPSSPQRDIQKRFEPQPVKFDPHDEETVDKLLGDLKDDETRVSLRNIMLKSAPMEDIEARNHQTGR